MNTSSSSGSKRPHPGDSEIAQQLYVRAKESECKLMFTSSFGQRDLRLFEVPEEIAQKVIEGQDLKMIGDSNGDTVLCTKNKTYTMKKVETSNHLFLTGPSATNSFTLTSRVSDYYEIKISPPRVEQIEFLLRPTQYDGDEAEAEKPVNKKDLFSRAELMQRVQASEEEFNAALQSAGVIEIDGKMRLVSKSAMREVSRALVDTVMENGWSLTGLNVERCRAAMTVDKMLLQLALSTMGSETNDGLWDLNADIVARTTALGLFVSNGPSKRWEAQDFLLSWGARTPGIDSPNSDLLRGICVSITDDAAHQSYYRYCPAEGMTTGPAERLTTLFSIKSKYTIEELTPYFVELIGESGGKPKSVAELLLQYARCVDGLYVAK